MSNQQAHNGIQAHKRIIEGQVVSKAGSKSAVVLVERKVVHPKYRKIVKRFKKYIIHDKDSILNIGDVVSAVECAPISRHKAFVLKEVISKGV